jgi:hypothetical protein
MDFPPMRLARLAAAAALLAALPAAGPGPGTPAQPPDPGTPFTFAVFGDMPYCGPRDTPASCAAEVTRVEAVVDAINAAQPAFTLYLGDTKGGAEACTDAIVFDRTLGWMNRVEGPLVYTPGDNEWTDCWQDRAGRYDPLVLLGRIRERFFAEPRSLGRAPMALTRQADVDPAHRTYVENARWRQDGVMFLTVHVPGSDNNRPPDSGPVPPGAAQEYPARNAANLAWIADSFALAARDGDRAVVVGLQADLYYRDRCGRGTEAGHADTRRALAEAARRFGRPVLLLHGDSHFYLLDQPVPEVPNLRRLLVPGDKDTRAVLVHVDPGAADPFRADLIGPDDRPAEPRC